MISTLNKYLARRVFTGILLACVIITSIIMLVDIVETSRDLDNNSGITLLTLIILTSLNAPQLVEQTIPFAVLFGVMGTLFSLNKRSEFIVMRATGLSAWKFLKPTIIISALIGIVWAMAFNPLASISAHKRQQLVAALASGSTPVKSDKDIWFKEANEDGHWVIHARNVDLANHKIFNVTFYYFQMRTDNTLKFSARYDAKVAKLYERDHWVLGEITENYADGTKHYLKTRSIPTTTSLETLRSHSEFKKTTPFWKIQDEIKEAKRVGFDTTRLVMQYNKLLALPITLIAMSIIAAGASINLSREGGTLRLLISGGALGFGVYFADSIISAFGETHTLPPLFAAWSVPIFVLCLGIVYLSKIEDG